MRVAVWVMAAVVGALPAQTQRSHERSQCVEELIGDLGSPDKASVAAARRELIALGPVAIPQLLDAAAGSNIVRAEPAREILTALAPRAIEDLNRAGATDAYDHPKRYAEAMAAVARVGAPLLPRILELFTTTDPAEDLFGFSVGVLWRMDGLAVEPLIPLLKHPTPQVRHRAATLLARLADPRSFDALIEGLRSGDPSVRQPCAQGLGNLRDHRAAQPLLDALGDREATTREAAAAALGKIQEPRFVEPLARLARADAAISVRNVASRVLMSYRDDPVARRLGKRFKPWALSPERQPWILLGFLMRMALTAGAMVGFAFWLAWQSKATAELTPGALALLAVVSSVMGFLWGFVVDNIWGTLENLLLFGVIPAAGVVSHFVLVAMQAPRRWVAAAWLSLVVAFYAGYGVGWMALWGYFGF